jgi:A/G-specific adenine glycosylase
MLIEPDTSERKILHPTVAREISRILTLWGIKNYQNFPWRNAEKPWHGLIAEILLQRTRADNVVPIYRSFIETFKNPLDLATAPVEKIEQIIYPLGLKWRAPLLKKLGEYLVLNENNIPDEIEKLKKIPGVGDYAAAAWLGFMGGKRSVIVDANIVRFICRITGNKMDGETRRKKWLKDIADLITPEKNWKNFNYAILDFTMLVCKKKPDCISCPINIEFCTFIRETKFQNG